MKYTIKRGAYRPFSLPSLSVESPTSRTIRFTFSQSCWYDPTAEWNVEQDWNKLYGWSYGILPKKLPGKSWYLPSSWKPSHQWNSVRIGWRSMGTQEEPRISLCLYTYQDGVRSTTTLLQPDGEAEDIYLDTEYNLTMDTEEGQLGVHLTLGNGAFLTHQTEDYRADNGPSYELHPFFGGSNPSPHTMTIDLTVQ